MKHIIYILILICISGTSFADSSYTQVGNYFLKDGWLHTRSQTFQTQRVWNGRYWCSVQHPVYTYTRYQQYTVPAIHTPVVEKKIDINARLLELAEKRIHNELSIKEKELHNKQVIEGLKALGFSPDETLIDNPEYISRVHKRIEIAPIDSGSTLYGTGYNYQEHSVVDLNAGMNRAANLIELSNKTSNNAFQNYIDFYKNAHSSQEKLQKMQLLGQLMIEAAKNDTKVTIDETISNESVSKEDKPQQDFTELKQLITNKCISCHGADKQDGNFDIRDWFTLSSDKKMSIFRDRINTDNASKVMPRLPNGEGSHLSPNEKLLFLQSI